MKPTIISPSYIKQLAVSLDDMRMPSTAEDLRSCSKQIIAFMDENKENVSALEGIHSDLVDFNVKLPAKTYAALNHLISKMRN